MRLSEFNQAPIDAIQVLLQYCVHIERWSKTITEQRPFATQKTLLEFAKIQASTWTWDEIFSALNTHPRIGEKKAQAKLSEKEKAFSEREQSALAPNQETLNELYQGNVAYEKKFGFIFLIKASGLDSQQILTALNYRLVNDLETEKRIVHQQLLEIALLRLEQEVQA